MIASNDTLNFHFASDDTYNYLVQLDHRKFKQLKEIYDYSYGKTDLAPKPVTLIGMPVNIDDELFTIAHESFNEIFGENISSAEFRDIIGYTYLDTSREPMDAKDFIAILSFFPALVFVISIFLWIYQYITDKKFIDTYDPKLEEDLKNQLPDAKTFKMLKMIFLKDYIICSHSAIKIIPKSDILWVYPTKHSMNFIPTNRDIVAGLKNGKYLTLASILRGSKTYRKEFEEVYMLLTESLPEAMFGHTPENEKTYKDLTKKPIKPIISK